MRKGLFRKGGELLVVVLAFITEYALQVAAQAHVATFLSIYIVIMESLSVLENLDQAGIPLPGIIRDKLGKVKQDMDGGADNA
jgi:phage-related holin